MPRFTFRHGRRVSTRGALARGAMADLILCRDREEIEMMDRNGQKWKEMDGDG